MLLLVSGDVYLLDGQERTVGVENWRSAVARYLEHCRDNGLEPRDVTARRATAEGLADAGAAA
jgi:hypothetical protein